MKAAGSWYTESVSRPSAIDAPVTLGDLLGLEELRDIVALYRELHGMDVSIADRSGTVVASTTRDLEAVHAALALDRGEPAELACSAPDARLALHPMCYEGRHLATVLVGA
jgi:hypothetical protein